MPRELISKTEFGKRCKPPISRQAVDKAIAAGKVAPFKGNLMRASDVETFNQGRAIQMPAIATWAGKTLSAYFERESPALWRGSARKVDKSRLLAKIGEPDKT